MTEHGNRWISFPDTLSHRDSKKIFILVGGTSVIVIGGWMLYQVLSRRSSLSPPFRTKSNGSVVQGSRPGGFSYKNRRPTNPGGSIVSSPVESRGRLVREESEDQTVNGFPSLVLDTDGVTNSSRKLSNSSASLHYKRRRQRSDSLTSGTTLLLTSRSPFELMLYGLESLKRSIRLFEETRNKMTLEVEDFGSASRENSPDVELDFILCKSKQLSDDVDSYLKEHFSSYDTLDGASPTVSFRQPLVNGDISHDGNLSNMSLTRSKQENQFGSNVSLATTMTMPFFDIEPNIHFFKMYTNALDSLENIPATRTDRTTQVNCESHEEYLAKVHCLRQAFQELLSVKEHAEYFRSIGQDILEIVLSHSLTDPTACLSAFDTMIEFVSNPINHPLIQEEISHRNIPFVCFYDLVLDYILLESFDDLESPPSAVTSVANNRWLSSGFRELALQTAVTAVLRHKRAKVNVKGGFFEHFYNILEHVSPVLAWGFLGSDGNLKLKCNLIKDAVLNLVRGYFSFDRVRYTSMHDLKEDILRITDDDYDLLRRHLSVYDDQDDSSEY